MKLSIIIVNYNVKYFLEQTLLSVRKAAAGIATEVWVVDNNSVDDSVQMVREKFPEVRVLANTENVGFSKANNQAIRQSVGEYVLLLNPDTVVEEDTFEKCIAFMDAQPEAGGLGVRMIDGSGKFLPESKRGFPSPFVAFSKTFGLSKFFPKSKLFNRYHLGYLPENEIHEVDVLSGAFMLMRRSALDKIGLLDERFFMYGEDIDLSYRIVLAGYKNYYFPTTTIIHYKGESTKKGSLNYVRTFYNAMILFAKKHFEGRQARLFVLMLQGAIYFRAALTLISNWIKRLYLPLLDAVVIFGGLVFLKNFWANYHFNDSDYYPLRILYLNFPMYILIWLVSIYFNGGYDEKDNLRRLVRGLLIGSLVLAAVYGFLPLEYRASRVLILLGTAWALISTIGLRYILHFMRFRNFNIGRSKIKNLVIVGSKQESERTLQLLQQAQITPNFIGTVAPTAAPESTYFLSNLSQLDEVVHIYRINEIIFCSQDVSSQDIMRWMSRLGPMVEYKILPKESLSIIGSSSKNSSGELYTIDIQFNINQPLHRRNKRLLDVLLCIFLLLVLPLSVLVVKRKIAFLQNIFNVLSGKKTWVSYAAVPNATATLPMLRPGVLSPLDALKLTLVNPSTVERLNFLYAKDYEVSRDWEIFWKGLKNLGR